MARETKDRGPGGQEMRLSCRVSASFVHILAFL